MVTQAVWWPEMDRCRPTPRYSAISASPVPAASPVASAGDPHKADPATLLVLALYAADVDRRPRRRMQNPPIDRTPKHQRRPGDAAPGPDPAARSPANED